VKSRNSSQCNETLLVMTVRPGKKFGFQSAAENLQRQRRPDPTPADCSRPMQRSPMVERTARGTTSKQLELELSAVPVS